MNATAFLAGVLGAALAALTMTNTVADVSPAFEETTFSAGIDTFCLGGTILIARSKWPASIALRRPAG